MKLCSSPALFYFLLKTKIKYWYTPGKQLSCTHLFSFTRNLIIYIWYWHYLINVGRLHKYRWTFGTRTLPVHPEGHKYLVIPYHAKCERVRFDLNFRSSVPENDRKFKFPSCFTQKLNCLLHMLEAMNNDVGAKYCHLPSEKIMVCF